MTNGPKRSNKKTRRDQRRKGAGSAPTRRRDGARVRALRALLAVEAGAGSQAALNRVLQHPTSLSPVDRGLTTTLVYGTLRHRRRLDRWIAPACRDGLRKLAPEPLEVLRLGTLQMAMLSRIPSHAAVHATVEAAKALMPRGKIGFIHAVLRRLDRERPWTEDRNEGDLPRWLERRILHYAEQLGNNPRELLEAFEAAAPVHVHVFGPDRDATLLDARAEGLTLEPIANIPGAHLLLSGELFASRVYDERRLIAQDAASTAVAHWVDAQNNDRIADIAAGRGVKSLALAKAGARVSAVDQDQDKLEAAVTLLERAGCTLTETVSCDASVTIPLAAGSFDRVLVDAPCTGLGTLRRRPEIRHRRNAVDIYQMSRLQARLLQTSATLVRPGGVLVFATCSFTEEEGPLLVERFLQSNANFRRAPLEASWCRPLLDARGDIRSHPMLDGMDAFYAARLLRTNDGGGGDP